MSCRANSGSGLRYSIKRVARVRDRLPALVEDLPYSVIGSFRSADGYVSIANFFTGRNRYSPGTALISDSRIVNGSGRCRGCWLVIDHTYLVAVRRQPVNP